MKYIAPNSLLGIFTCPHCDAIAQINWNGKTLTFSNAGDWSKNVLRVGTCSCCGEATIWLEGLRLYPDLGSAPPPNSDMPQSVLRLYDEAATISVKSPRGAAALLRLGIQQLCIDLGEDGKNINHDIGELVKRGLLPKVQKALDVVRVTGNSAVHPGQIDTDNENVVAELFGLLNVIVESMISIPKQVDTLYERLPENSKKQIEERDS
jgi:hypothetical protein